MLQRKDKIAREQALVCRMIALYCRHHLHQKEMSEPYRRLADYACRRLERCRFGNEKGPCQHCPKHCYEPQSREMIRRVMRWAGPRMLLYAPVQALRHLLRV